MTGKPIRIVLVDDHLLVREGIKEILERERDLQVLASADADHATYVDLYAPFKGADGSADPTDVLAADGDHPNAAGHEIIAQALLRAGTAPLRLA